MLGLFLGIRDMAVNMLSWRQAINKYISKIYSMAGAEDDYGEK